MYDMGKPKPKRRYSESDKATALAMLQANGGNVKGTADELGIPEPTLRKWHNGQGVVQDVAQKCEEKKEELDALFERVAYAYLTHALSAETLASASGKDAVLAAAVATDKRQLLRGEPTNIDEQRHRVRIHQFRDRYGGTVVDALPPPGTDGSPQSLPAPPADDAAD